jgi:hypothetical protein
VIQVDARKRIIRLYCEGISVSDEPTAPPPAEPPYEGPTESAAAAHEDSTGEAWDVPPTSQQSPAPEAGPVEASGSEAGQFAGGTAMTSSTRTGRWSRIRGVARRRRTVVGVVGVVVGVVVGAAAGAVIATAAVGDAHHGFDGRGDGQSNTVPGDGPAAGPAPAGRRAFDHGDGEH